MSGFVVVGQLLDASAAFTAAVPADHFDYDDLPQGTGLPSVLLTSISRVEQQFLAAQQRQMVTERIQATVRANSTAQRDAILGMIRDGCRDKRPTVPGLASVAVLLAGDGPKFKDADAAIYIGSTDLRVSFTTPA